MKQLNLNKEFFVKNSNSGMELVQVAILIAIAIVVGLIFKDSISNFVEKVFGNLNSSF